MLAGKFMVDKDAVRILGRPAFHDITLAASGELSYLGAQWRRDVAFAGYDVPIQARRCPTVKVLNRGIHSLLQLLPMAASSAHSSVVTAAQLTCGYAPLKP